jgi:hypothetical protein
MGTANIRREPLREREETSAIPAILGIQQYEIP